MEGKFNQLCVLEGCLMPKGGAKKLDYDRKNSSNRSTIKWLER